MSIRAREPAVAREAPGDETDLGEHSQGGRSSGGHERRPVPESWMRCLPSLESERGGRRRGVRRGPLGTGKEGGGGRGAEGGSDPEGKTFTLPQG